MIDFSWSTSECQRPLLKPQRNFVATSPVSRYLSSFHLEQRARLAFDLLFLEMRQLGYRQQSPSQAELQGRSCMPSDLKPSSHGMESNYFAAGRLAASAVNGLSRRLRGPWTLWCPWSATINLVLSD